MLISIWINYWWGGASFLSLRRELELGVVMCNQMYLGWGQKASSGLLFTRRFGMNVCCSRLWLSLFATWWTWVAFPLAVACWEWLFFLPMVDLFGILPHFAFRIGHCSVQSGSKFLTSGIILGPTTESARGKHSYILQTQSNRPNPRKPNLNPNPNLPSSYK